MACFKGYISAYKLATLRSFFGRQVFRYLLVSANMAISCYHDSLVTPEAVNSDVYPLCTSASLSVPMLLIVSSIESNGL